MSSNFIKDFWNNQGKVHGSSHWASWGDEYMIDLEVDTISENIRKGDTVLDVGCANGHSAVKQFDKGNARFIQGIDFAENMIVSAKECYEDYISQNKVSFDVGDVQALSFEDNSFDVVYTTRVLINLPTFEQQLKGIQECLRVAKPNGKVILSEAFWEPLMLLNAMRQLVGLPSLVEHDFNRYLKLNVLKEHLTQNGLDFEVNDFSSVYYLGSRLLRELVTNADDYEGYSNPINKFFFELEKEFSGGGMGIQQAVIITKK